jgi:predicted regulator of Ras-like GTPase activity (Roadblock/LC7/MglB family)
MGMQAIPDALRANHLAAILDDIRTKYYSLVRAGQMHGLMIADQDAKVLAVNSFFDQNLSYWDIAALGAALYGVSKQGRDFFKAQDLDKAAMFYKNAQFFVNYINSVQIDETHTRELILIVLGDRAINIGMIFSMMKQFAEKIKAAVEQDHNLNATMKMSEDEFMKQIHSLKKELFSLAR